MVLLLAAFAWILAWALAGRLATRNANFYAHANIALIGIAAGILVHEVSGYLAFAFSSETLPRLSLLLITTILGAMLFRHVRLVSRAPARRVALVAIALVGALSGGAWLMNYAADTDYTTRLRYATELKAPAFLLREPQTPQEFSQDAVRLRQEIDRLREGS
jgi:hypothetical protein